MTNESFPRNEREISRTYIGRCSAKGCGCVVKVRVPVKLWTETRRNHAAGFSFPVSMSRELVTPDQSFVHCRAHKRPLAYRGLQVTLKPEHKCDARCTSAKGHSCECSCGGKNHGAGFQLINL